MCSRQNYCDNYDKIIWAELPETHYQEYIPEIGQIGMYGNNPCIIMEIMTKETSRRKYLTDKYYVWVENLLHPNPFNSKEEIPLSLFKIATIQEIKDRMFDEVNSYCREDEPLDKEDFEDGIWKEILNNLTYIRGLTEIA